MTETQKLREALRRIKHESASLADAQVIALEALSLPADGTQAAAYIENGVLVHCTLPVGFTGPLYTTPPASKPAEGGEVAIAALEAIANGDLGGWGARRRIRKLGLPIR